MKKIFRKNEISEISKKLLDFAGQIKNKEAKILAFSGDLGSGKTTLTQEIARQLGIKEKIVSPTFVIMKFYNIKKNSLYYSKFKNLIHIDAYRLEAPEELLKIGWLEILADNNNLIIIEWPEKVKKYLKKETVWFKLEHVDEENRRIELLK